MNVVLLFTYIHLFFISVISYFLLHKWWLLFYEFLIVSCTLYWTHRLGHNRDFWFAWYSAHVYGHHCQAYPSTRFRSSKYVINTKDPYQLNTWAYLLFVTIAIVLSLMWIEFAIVDIIIVFSYLAVVLVFEVTIHDELHLTIPSKNIYRTAEWFNDIRAYHLLHHTKECNYAIVSLFMDYIFGSLVHPNVVALS